ncbi:MAG: hypothetical protein A3F09_02400 [Chlamydiae bacterium RIFCSPHIGHO2_12_FULL_49_11]|nr:MAG: hypothetical protein A3F09_02400 [Chlamydiae bacterium RIFCSPHIGHO2_12_FULL_49_11]
MERDVEKKAEETLKDWLKEPYDKATRDAVKELVQNNPNKIEVAFGERLKFGTAGLRAEMGPGPGLMNKYTVQMVTQGLADYISTFGKAAKARGVAICHDCRIHSRLFAETAASVLAGNGIAVYIVKDLRPTPFLSFAVRELKCIAGINITASHNPKEYNGYKVYWEDGAQVTFPHDTEIIKSIDKITRPVEVSAVNLDHPLIRPIEQKTEAAYFRALQRLAINPHFNREKGKTLTIIYSPLNGAGITMIPEALRLWGFKSLHLVKEQEKPDGNFPTTPYPNPETEEALKLGLLQLQDKKADLLLVSDPDSDRLSCSLLHGTNAVRLTGNQLGILLLDYLIRFKQPTSKWAVVTTVVSSPLIRKMTEKHGGTCFEVLTGFKYIGEKIHQWEETDHGYNFLFGMEESLGYLYGTHARDKDATIAALMTCEMALCYKQKKQDLVDRLSEIYAEYGIHVESQHVIEMDPKKMGSSMAKLRQNLPTHLCNHEIIAVEDYLSQKKLTLKTKREETLTLPKSDMLILRMQHANLIIRPSGTEPKIKIYGQAWAASENKLQEELAALFSAIQLFVT